MEPLSAAASVIAVVQIADRIAGLCRAYITGVRDAPADLWTILIEVGCVKCVLQVIELLDPSVRGDYGVEILEKIRVPLDGCREVLKSLEGLFPSESDEPVRGKKKKLDLSFARLSWPLKRNRALRLLEDLARHKSTIQLSLATDAAQDLKYIRRNVERIQECTEHGEMDKILDWLVTINPSSDHNNACRLHEEHTGKWFINSPEYAD